MPVLQVTAQTMMRHPSDASQDQRKALGRALDTPGPVICMIHGYKFSPGHPRHCPHTHVLSPSHRSDCWKAISWPVGLGFGAGLENEGVGIGFGWSARGTIWQAYAEASKAGMALARLVRDIHDLSPGRDIHFFCHSLGARVALTALTHLPSGSVHRAILLNPAEFGTTARAALRSPGGASADVLHITSRENDLFDFLLERLVPPPRWGDKALGVGLPGEPKALTLHLDHAPTLEALRDAGFAIAPPRGRVCHWSTYLRPGVFDLYRAAFRQPDQVTLAHSRNVLPGEVMPPWSRLLPGQELRLSMSLRRRAEL